MLQMIKDMPPLPLPKKVRIKFSKKGELIYISHLDLVRTLTRAIIRARIPIKYTEGYNPIPKMTFATPLSVGCASECEYLDIKIDREITLCKIKEQLSSQVPEGITILDVYEPNSKFTEALYSSYNITIRDKSIDEGSASILNEVFSQNELVITKRTKSGEKEVNILPFIKELKVTSEQGRCDIFTKLCVSSADFLNPEYIVGVVYSQLKLSKDNFDCQSGYGICRETLYLSDCVSEFR